MALVEVLQLEWQCSIEMSYQLHMRPKKSDCWLERPVEVLCLSYPCLPVSQQKRPCWYAVELTRESLRFALADEKLATHIQLHLLTRELGLLPPPLVHNNLLGVRWPLRSPRAMAIRDRCQDELAREHLLVTGRSSR